MSKTFELSSELVDVVDRNGEPTGKIVDKAIAHRDELWHRDVHVWITNGTEFLEQQRARDKSIMPLEWDVSASGHVGTGQSFEEAAIRETDEELGPYFNGMPLIPIGRMAVEMAMDGGTWTHRVVGENFVVVASQLTRANLHDVVAFQRSEIEDVRLYSIDQLEADLRSPDTAGRHAQQPQELWDLGIEGMRRAIAA